MTTTVIGTLPELIGYSPEKLYLQVEGNPVDLDADGHALLAHVGSVVSFVVDSEMSGTLYVARICDTILISGTPTESVIWTGFAVFENGGWTLQQNKPVSLPAARTIVDGFSTDGRAQLLSALIIANDDGTLDLESSCIPVVSGSDWRIDFTAIGDLTDRTNLVFAIKSKASDPDAAALALIDKDGLKVTNGQVAGTPGNGSIVVTDQVAGTGYVLVKAAATLVPSGQKRVGLKVIKATGEIRNAELWRPCVTVVDGIVDAVS
jgi:hypothetical protein